MNREELKNLYPKMPEQFIKAVDQAVCDGLREDGKVIRMKKKILLAIAATLVVGVTAIGAGKAVMVTSHNDWASEFTDADKIADMRKELKLDFKFIKEFTNGYVFSEGYTSSNTELDENNTELRDYKTLDLEYYGESGKILLTIEEYTGNNDTEEGEFTAETEIYKIVPLDYEMSEQDKKDMESGKYEFITSGGIEQVSEEEHHKVTWHEDGISYGLLQWGKNGDLSIDEMLEMAAEISSSVA